MASSALHLNNCLLQLYTVVPQGPHLLRPGKAAGPRHTRSMGNAALQVLPRRQQLSCSDVSHGTFPLGTPVCTLQPGGSSSAFRKALGMSTDLRLALYTSQCIQPNSARALFNWVLGCLHRQFSLLHTKLAMPTSTTVHIVRHSVCILCGQGK